MPNQLSRRQSQQGAALIVVLLFLILIMLAGIIAVKKSNTDLKLATADQVSTLLLNSSDNSNKTVENLINTNIADQKAITQKNVMLSPIGLFGYFMGINANDNQGDQIVFCYRPRNDYFFRMSEATVITPDGGNKIVAGSGSGGFCRLNQAEDYTNARQNVMTQIAVTKPRSDAVTGEAFEQVPLGKSIATGDVMSSSYRFRIISTSLLPSMSAVSVIDSEISDCLKKPNENAADYGYIDTSQKGESSKKNYDQTVIQCLAKKGIPAKVLVEDVNLKNILTTKTCTSYGKGTGSITEECQKLLNVDSAGRPK